MTRYYDKNGVELTEVAQADIDNAESVGKYYWGSDKKLYIIVEKESYEDIAAARTGLGTTRLIYQLATAIVSDTDIIGGIDYVGAGYTVYWLPSIHGFATFPFGQNKITVSTPDNPATSIRKVLRFDMEGGKITSVDVSANASITDSGTTLTLTGADPTKTYFYELEPSTANTTVPTLVAEYEAENGTVTHDYQAAAADWVLSTNEAKARLLVCTNAEGAAKIIAPAAEGKIYTVRNASGYAITIKTSTSTGITVANGYTATVVYYSTDYIKIAEV